MLHLIHVCADVSICGYWLLKNSLWGNCARANTAIIFEKTEILLSTEHWYAFWHYFLKPAPPLMIIWWRYCAFYNSSTGWNLFLDASSHLYKRVCPSVCPSVGPSIGPSVRRSVRYTRVGFPRNSPNSNKIASGIRKYAIWKTIQRQVRGQLARTHLLSELCSTCF